VSVRGGGHSVGGLAICDQGIVIDLSHMERLQVDPVTATARAEAGLTLGEFTRGTLGGAVTRMLLELGKGGDASPRERSFIAVVS
jgi:hypothetical protein